MPIEIQKLIGEVAARNHCRIEASDPIFAVSTINRLMLDEGVEGLIVRVSAAITAFESLDYKDAHASIDPRQSREICIKTVPGVNPRREADGSKFE